MNAAETNKKSNWQIAKGKPKPKPVILSEISRNIRYPDEFLQRIISTLRMIDFRDFTELTQVEFQNRMFAEIKRIIESGTPHPSSRLTITAEERAPEIPVGTLKINLEKVQTWTNDGMTAFRLRKEGGQWQSYQSDQDNSIVMHLPAGGYYLKVGGILRKTFFLIAGTKLHLSVD